MTDLKAVFDEDGKADGEQSNTTNGAVTTLALDKTKGVTEGLLAERHAMLMIGAATTLKPRHSQGMCHTHCRSWSMSGRIV